MDSKISERKASLVKASLTERLIRIEKELHAMRQLSFVSYGSSVYGFITSAEYSIGTAKTHVSDLKIASFDDDDE